ISIRPLDSVLNLNQPPDSSPLSMLFETLDAKSMKRTPKTDFTVGDRYIIHIRPTRQVNVEIVISNPDGTQSYPNLGAHGLIDGNEDKDLGGSGTGYPVPGKTGKVRLTVFASETELPPAEVLKTKRPNERVIHRFYTLPGQKSGDFDPAR